MAVRHANLLGIARTEPDELRRAFARALYELRTKRGISQEHLALEADANRSYMSDLEQGFNDATVRMVFRLAPHLNTTPAKFISLVERYYRRGS